MMKTNSKKLISFILTLVFIFSAVLPVFQAASEIKLNKSKIIISVGQAYTLRLSGTKRTPVWKTSNKKIADVNKSGIVSGKAKGNAEISVTIGKKVLKCKVTVEKPSLSKTNEYVIVGKTFALKLNGTARNAKWQSGNAKIAAVNQKGLVKGISKGTTKITATLGGKSYTCKVTVTKPGKFTVKTTNIKIEDKKTLTVGYSGNDLIYYNVDNPNILSCKWANGWDGDNIKLFITTKKSGKTKITLTNEAKTEKVVINVIVNKPKPVSSVSLSDSFATLYYGDQKKNFNHIKLKASVVPADTTRKIVWSSNDETVATVNQNGRVTAVDYGEATITARCGNKTATCNIEVFEHPLEGIDFSIYQGTGKNTDMPTVCVKNYSDRKLPLSLSNRITIRTEKRYIDMELFACERVSEDFNNGWRVNSMTGGKCYYRSKYGYDFKITSETTITVPVFFGDGDYLVKISPYGYSYTPYSWDNKPIKKSEQFLYYGD